MSDRAAETEYSALQALLQIRTDQGEGAAIGETGGSDATSNVAQSTAATAAAAANANNIANLLRMGAAPASLLQQSAQTTFTPTQLAAVRAAAAAAASSLGRNGLLNLQNPNIVAAGQHSSLFDAISRDPSLVAAANIAVPRSPALSPLRPAPAMPRSDVKGSTDIGEGPHIASASLGAAEEVEKKVRKDEVEAALRSKPQRGRKRENLNAEERLELTRTRNREHALSLIHI